MSKKDPSFTDELYEACEKLTEQRNDLLEVCKKALQFINNGITIVI